MMHLVTPFSRTLDSRGLCAALSSVVGRHQGHCQPGDNCVRPRLIPDPVHADVRDRRDAVARGPLEDGKREGGRLPRPSRGLPDQITARVLSTVPAPRLTPTLEGTDDGRGSIPLNFGSPTPQHSGTTAPVRVSPVPTGSAVGSPAAGSPAAGGPLPGGVRTRRPAARKNRMQSRTNGGHFPTRLQTVLPAVHAESYRFTVGRPRGKMRKSWTVSKFVHLGSVWMDGVQASSPDKYDLAAIRRPGGIMANGGLAPSKDSVFYKDFGVQVERALACLSREPAEHTWPAFA